MAVSAVDGVKEGGVRRGAERARDICGEGSVFKVRDGGSSGVDDHNPEPLTLIET